MKESTNLFFSLHIDRLFLIAMTLTTLILSGCKEKKEPNSQSPAPIEQPSDPVKSVPIQSVSLSKASYTFYALGQVLQLTCTISPSNATYSNITWKSSNVMVATVSQDGLVTSKGYGSATIIATVDGMSATCAITANAVVVDVVMLTETSHKFSAVGQTFQLTFKVLPSIATYKSVTWQTSNSSVATVSCDGLVSCMGVGNATITLTVDGKSDVCSLTAVELGSVRDVCGNTYRTVKIGSQWWMAENLRCNKYDTQSARAGVTLSTCVSIFEPYYTDSQNVSSSYNDILTSDQLSKLGYYYNWAAAVGLATESASDDQDSPFNGNCQGICPNGWHVPTSDEWSDLENHVGSYAGKKLKTTSGWYHKGNGTDNYFFSALPAGDADGNKVLAVGWNASFWTSTPVDRDKAYYRGLYCYEDKLASSWSYKNYAKSVRCVKN